MANKQNVRQTTKSSGLRITHPDTAGIDVGKDLMQVSVPNDRCEKSNRCFGTFTKDLNDILDWLQQCGIKRVVMESTGIYWKYIPSTAGGRYRGLAGKCQRGQEQAGRKTDVCDADWLIFLGSCDLIKPCYHVEAFSRRLREYSRLRNVKIRDMTRELHRMQKAMEQMNIKLGSIISDIYGQSGMKIIHAILEGKRDPQYLASLASDRCRRSKEEIASALDGIQNIFSALNSRVETYEFLKKQVEQCDARMQIFLDSYPFETPVDETARPINSAKKQICKKNKIAFDIERYAYQIFGVNLMKIPGVSHATLLTLISELGPGFCDKFASASKFSRWCNLTPVDRITGGEIKSSNLPRRKNLVGQAFRNCAMYVQKRGV